VIGLIGAANKNETSLYVTFGVTWGEPTCSSASQSERMTPDVTSAAIQLKPCAEIRSEPARRGKFVETAKLAVQGDTPKSLKKMVGATGIEPVTPTMSR
jgi:hypothetical protein